MRYKLSDVALRAGVSVTTVSRVLNNRGALSNEVKRKVGDAIRELDYHPNEVARSLLTQRTRLVGLILPTVADPFFGEVAAEVEVFLAEEGYKMLLCDSLDSAHREAQYLSLLLANQVDGIITGSHNKEIENYRTTNLPIVAIDREISDAIPNIRNDNYGGARAATELLIECGCTSILHITASDTVTNSRATAYRDAMASAGLPEQVLTYGFARERSERRATIEDWLDHNPVDGIFASDDLSAMMAVEWARRNDVDIPQKLRIIGYDGTTLLRQIFPGLTTVQQPIREIARSAVSLLLKRVAGEDTSEFADTVLPFTIERGWTC